MAGIRREIECCVSDVVNGKCGARDAIVDGPMGMRCWEIVVTFSDEKSEFRRNSPMGGENSREGLQRLLSSVDSLWMRSIWLWWMREAV